MHLYNIYIVPGFFFFVLKVIVPGVKLVVLMGT